MNATEEQLWSYIDGACSPAERRSIEALIAQDEAYRIKYNELLQLNAEFAAMDLDQPPMAFTYNVMEGIRAEVARQPLKAAINKRIVLGIAAFFIISIVAILVFAFSQVNWGAEGGPGFNVKLPQQLNVTHIRSIFSAPVVQGFLFFDVVMGLFLLDHYMRKRSGLKV